MCVTDRHDMTLAVKLALNPNTTNQPTELWGSASFISDRILQNTTAFWLGASDSDIEGIWKWVAKDEELTYSEWDVK